MDKKRTSWGSVASEYDEAFIRDGDSYHAAVVAPNLLRLMAPKAGMRVLEVGCGDGFFSREIAKSGAHVTGSDIAAEMVARAKELSPKDIGFQTAPAEDLAFAKPASFDAVLYAFSIQNIEKLAKAFEEAKRVLKAGGSIYIVMNHPVLRIPKRSSWGFDQRASVQYRRLDAYISESGEKIDMDPGKTEGKRYTYSFHRPLQVYFKALAKNGFAVDAMEEWISHKKSEPGPRAAAEDTARKEFPMFMMLRARKMI